MLSIHMQILAIGVDIAEGDVIVTFADGVTARYPVALLREMISRTLPNPELDDEPDDRDDTLKINR